MLSYRQEGPIVAFKDSNYCGAPHPRREGETCILAPFHWETGKLFHATGFNFKTRLWDLAWWDEALRDLARRLIPDP
ncbi:MAG TPA: hypothetical protein VI953_01015 [Candidatus Paceibacterota bacterium]